MKEIITYNSNGKLLITGEYLVLDGALAFAIPLKVGQNMKVFADPINKNQLHWSASDTNGLWFKAIMDMPTLVVKESSNYEIAKNLIKYLKAAKQLNPEFLEDSNGLNIESHCSFNIQWGLGSSSTFISNLAWWAHIDPYKLQSMISSGSGYDIACARSDKPILYNLENNLPKIQPSTFDPKFINQIYFIYLGKKQDTSSEINLYKKIKAPQKSKIDLISSLTFELVKAKEISDFKKIIKEHERVISEIINIPSIKAVRFNDFNGEIKSLGAWGGDFILAASDRNENETINYFQNAGYQTIFKYTDIVKQMNRQNSNFKTSDINQKN